MNEIKEIRYFSALTFDNNTYNFAVTPEGEIYCNEFGISIPAYVIELKPNFVLRDQGKRTLYSLDDHINNRNKTKSLIKEFIIESDLFEYLKNNHMVVYSTDMAFLYGFDPGYAYDAYSQKRAFKSYRNNEMKRTRILEKQKRGIFR